MNLSAAGNTEVPAYLGLLEKGYDVSVLNDRWIAQRPELQFSAESPLQLLGLVTLFEARGEAWQASDAEVDHFINRFC